MGNAYGNLYSQIAYDLPDDGAQYDLLDMHMNHRPNNGPLPNPVIADPIHQIEPQVRQELKVQLEPQVRRELRGLLEPQVRQQLKNELKNEVKDQLRAELESRVREELRSEMRPHVIA